jgi:hypothetical protein
MEMAAMAAVLPSLRLHHRAVVAVVYTTATTPEAEAQEGAVSFREGLVHQAKEKTEVVDTLKPMLPPIRAAEAEGRRQMAATAQVVPEEAVETDYIPQ